MDKFGVFVRSLDRFYSQFFVRNAGNNDVGDLRRGNLTEFVKYSRESESLRELVPLTFVDKLESVQEYFSSGKDLLAH